MDIKKKQFNVIGMHCVTCAMSIENNLKKLAGVKSVNVNFATEKAAVEYDCAVCDEKKVVKAVKEAGYLAASEDFSEGGGDDGNKAQAAEIRNLRNKFVISLILSLPIMFLAL